MNTNCFKSTFTPLASLRGVGGGVLIALFGLLTMVGCKDEDENGPASQEQLHQVDGQWYAELPMSGQTDNWRTEEVGDMADYNEIGVIMYLNNTYTDNSYWGFIYMKDHDMVNYDGINRREVDTTFDFEMDREGNITIKSPWTDVPQVSNAHYDAEKDIITADATYKGHTLHNIVFTRPTEEQQDFLDDFWETLLEEGLVGYDDGGDEQSTNLTDKNATEPSRTKRI